MTRRSSRWVGLLAAAALSAGCNVGPKYARPPAATPPAYRELAPADSTLAQQWKIAAPSDATLHGDWWTIFNDGQLNSLEAQLNSSNQSIQQAMNTLLQARALVREAHAQLFPTVSAGPAINNSRNPLAGFSAAGTGNVPNFTVYSLPFDATWVPDLWGRVRNTIAANTANAQVSAADLENVRLTAQSELAVDYFGLRGQDALKQLLDSTVVAYQQSLQLTQALYETGIDSDEAVAQAETQLQDAQAADTNVGILRSQYEHAIATLTGAPASSFSLPPLPLNAKPPAVPVGVPSQLLERRPDVAAAERLVAAVNAQVGVARAAYFPTVTLSATGGFEATHVANWLTWPSRFWSLGPSASQFIYDAGLRRATVQQFRATYDADVAGYRQTVLTAFQQVEDSLSTLRILADQIKQQDAAVQSANRYLTLANDRYRLGIDPYLNVITAQTTYLNNQQTALTLRIQEMTTSVQLVEALGGGWDASQLPTAHDLISGSDAQLTKPPAYRTTAAPASQPSAPSQPPGTVAQPNAPPQSAPAQPGTPAPSSPQ